jgi:cyclohexyl-isocyanide hydratase
MKVTLGDHPDVIAMLIYPGMTMLDLAGPQQVFGYMMSTKIHLVAKTKEPVVTDTGIRLLPDTTFDDCPSAPDILFVPGGGMGTIQLMTDSATLGFLRSRGEKAQYVTSVCSGSMLLGAAGLLRGYKATSHWAVREVLPLLGATPVEARVVEDRNRITSGGVTAGIDFGLRICARLRGEDMGKGVELMLEYDPQPPFGSGTPEKAGERIGGAGRMFYAPVVEMARKNATAASAAWAKG